MSEYLTDPTSPAPTPIAIVEDDPLFAAHLKEAIEDSGRFTVVAIAGSAEEALAWPSSIRPSVLMLDVGLPGMLGSVAVKPLRLARPEMLILMLTANTDSGTLLDAMSAGAAGYLIKGGGIEATLVAIDQVLASEVPMSPGIARRLLNLMAPSRVAAPGIPPSPLGELTSRELEILQFVADGLADKEIADGLTIAQSTVKNHLANIYSKWNVRSRTEAAVRFVRAVK